VQHFTEFECYANAEVKPLVDKLGAAAADFDAVELYLSTCRVAYLVQEMTEAFVQMSHLVHAIWILLTPQIREQLRNPENQTFLDAASANKCFAFFVSVEQYAHNFKRKYSMTVNGAWAQLWNTSIDALNMKSETRGVMFFDADPVAPIWRISRLGGLIA
jgi:hypothetical protein